MSQEIPEYILNILESAKLEEGDFQIIPYSGRGMYGRECIGFDIDQPLHPIDFVLHIIKYSLEHESMVTEEGGDVAVECMESIIDFFIGSNIDQLGLGSVLYLPKYHLPEGYGLK